MNWLYVIILIAGIGFILYQIFLNSGGNAKFKSDLPEGIKVKSKRKRVARGVTELQTMYIDFVRDFIGTVDSSFDFIIVITAAVLFLVVCSLILSFFLAALSCLTTRFFKS